MGVVFVANAMIIVSICILLINNVVASNVSDSNRELKAYMDFGWPYINSIAHHCHWKGITCDNHGRVAEISLQSRVGCNDDESWWCHDVGYLDPLVFTSLTSIHLTSCGLYGVIPSQIGYLSNLSYLNVSHNHLLTSELPLSLANLSELLVLDLSSNEFYGGIPPYIGSLSNLIHLNLSHNRLESDLPLSLANLSELRVLDISDNYKINGVIPPEIGYLLHLIALDLNFNNINCSLPATMAQLTRLEILKLDGNSLEGVFEAGIHTLPSITTIGLSKNSIHGRIPIPFGDVPNA
ncbi:LRR receptor-like serine/threonine-protein kinase FLS2 [Salvia hispanica]|uniref:LRR receptor-like serine/threonine-protein kinase FLS2 n=1 Tax=Salvia hispanica TaxID=49212 RepID=UPI0020099120|nr:LRR receptor-like serine/threonine-protein kinase FLS2 [Salvia hispanica]